MPGTALVSVREVAVLAGLTSGREADETVGGLLDLINRMRAGVPPGRCDEDIVSGLQQRYERELDELERCPSP